MICKTIERQFVIDQFAKWGKIEVLERKILIDEVIKAVEEKRMIEAFLVGNRFGVVKVDSIGSNKWQVKGEGDGGEKYAVFTL